MGTARSPQSVRLFIGLISGQSSLFEEATRSLPDLFGPIEIASSLYPWNHTSHYQEELGKGLKRQFLFFREWICPGYLAEIKEKTNSLEERWAALTSKGPRRQMNLDPGYITPAKVVLATTKDFAHRIYLSRGIYAEVTLIYRGGRFQPLAHTYPDFCTEAYIELFGTVRDRLLR